MRSILALIAVVGLGSAGEATAKDLVKQPAELLVVISIGSDAALDPVRGFADAVKPGVGTLMTRALISQQLGKAVGADSLDGLDPSAPTYVLVVDGGAPVQGAAVVGRVADENVLARGLGNADSAIDGGWAVIGPKAVVDVVAHYALATLPSRPAVTAPTALVYVPKVLKRYHDEIEAGRKQFVGQVSQGGGPLAQITQSYVDGLYTAMSETEQVIATVDVTNDVGAIDLAMVPKAGSRLAKFVAAQRPSAFALLGKLPATAFTMIMAGHLDSGPYRAGLLDMMAAFYGQGESKELVAAIESIMKAATGELAATMRLEPGKPMMLSQVLGLADKKLADRSIGRFLDAFKAGRTIDMMGMSLTIKTSAPIVHDGVQLQGYEATYDTSKAAEPTRKAIENLVPGGTSTARIATFEQLCLVTFGGDPLDVIDVSHGKAVGFTPAAPLAGLLAEAIARKDSFVMLMDLGSFNRAASKGPPRSMVISTGFADKTAHLRVTLPLATVRGFVP